MEILNLLWNVFGFVLGLVWQVAWFILRDLISTVLWALIAAWLVLSVRFRSFTAGTLALLRYGGFALKLVWRWLRGTTGAIRSPVEVKQSRPAKLRRRNRLGTMSVSEQLNMLLVGAIYLLIYS